MAATVTLYTSAFCGYCHRAKALLAQKGVDYSELSVDGQPQRRREMERLSGRSTVPQIWIGTTHVGGCDELYALERAGRLVALLARAGE